MTQLFTAILLNLDRDVERREHMEQQLTRANIAFTRQPGILGDALPDDLRSLFFDATGRPLTTMKRGEIGCYASHVRALQRAARGDIGYHVLIMEDDLAIPTNFMDIIDEALKSMPATWDILRLSSPPRSAYLPIAKLKNSTLARYSKIPNSAGAYLVTPTGAQKFLRYGIRGLTFDDDLRRPWFHGMETWGIVPPPIRAGLLKSSIDSIEAGRFDKPFGSRVERIWRGDHFHFLKRLSYNMKDLGFINWLKLTAINLADMINKLFTGRSLIHRAVHSFGKELNER